MVGLAQVMEVQLKQKSKLNPLSKPKLNVVLQN
jgi:hypothetical protein